jgi:anti-sigma regulatory factor (Ser/Thr protein kinase)
MSTRREQWSGPAEASIVRELRHAVTAFAENGGFSGAGLDDVRACVSEAVTNAVVHAFAGRATGMVTVTGELNGDELLLRVSDDGAGFRPRTDSPGLGLGIPTIAALADSMSVVVSDTGGTELCMAFARERAAEPAIHG